MNLSLLLVVVAVVLMVLRDMVLVEVVLAVWYPVILDMDSIILNQLLHLVDQLNF